MKKLRKKFEVFYVYPLVSGFLLFLSFPKMDFFFFAWIALVPLLVALYNQNNWTAFRMGFLAGLVYFFGTTYWIYHSINVYGSVPFLTSLLIVLILCFYLSLYPALFSLLFSLTIKKTHLPVMCVAPLFWTALEFVRSYALTGFPWSSLGYSQYKFLPFIQIADITGIYGVSFLLVAFNGALADMLLLKTRRYERPLYPLLPTIVSFALVVALTFFTFSYGFYRLHNKGTGTDIKVAIVQGNIEQDEKWDRAYQQSVISVYKDLSLEAAKQNPVLIVWPETSVPFYFSYDKELSDDLISFQKSLNAYLLFGSVLVKKDVRAYASVPSPEIKTGQGEPGYTNSAVLLDKDGKVSYIYDKMHLVPFGEYVPLRKVLFFIEKLVFGIGDYIPGSSYIKAITPFGTFGTLICYEIIFPGLVRKFYTSGGDFIVTITNDAWFGRTSGPYQHFSMAVFRAIENRKPVIRAANTGISGVIDSAGRILSKTDLFNRTVLITDIKTDRSLTIYTKYGDILSYLCIVFSLLLLFKNWSK